MMDRVRRLIATRLAAVRLHRWTESSDGIRTKYRKAGTDVLIRIGNQYLALQGALSECLRCGEWIEWEVAIGRLLDRDVRAVPDRGGISFPSISGVTLAELLRSNACWEQKQRGVFLAANGLQRLHQQKLVASGGVDWPLSHGDATSCNVIIDGSESRAQWIDFDMRHRADLPTLLRQADDLRALIWSSAALVDTSGYVDLVAAACEGYACPDVVTEMRNLIRRTHAPTVFQLAQAPMSIADFMRLREIIVGGRIIVPASCRPTDSPDSRLCGNDEERELSGCE